MQSVDINTFIMYPQNLRERIIHSEKVTTLHILAALHFCEHLSALIIRLRFTVDFSLKRIMKVVTITTTCLFVISGQKFICISPNSKHFVIDVDDKRIIAYVCPL